MRTTLSDFESGFAELLERGPHGYFAGGAADELTLRANVSAWQALQLLPRVLVDVSKRDGSVSLLGKQRRSPFVVAPTAYHRLAHPRGEPETARGAAAGGAIFTLSTLATARPAEVAAGAPDSQRWFQLYVFKDRRVTDELLEEAESSGFEAIVLTVDLPLLGRRDRDLLSEFEIGQASTVPGVSAAGTTGTITMQDTADLIDASLTWRDLEALSARTSLPVLVKGILREDDARMAIEHGAAGVIVSNHGGRQLDTVPATAGVLQGIREALGPEATILVDGGIRRGTDALKALVLGADAVLVGRPILWGLACGGADGVEQVLAILADEFDRGLALVGVPKAIDLRGRTDLLAAAPGARH